MDNRTPLVTIVIPVYNGANYLNEAIDSALAQDYPNVEVIVVNDGSNDSDKTDAIARSYGEKIRYFHKKNGGVASALNLGIKEMRGEYFSWLSHDDLYYPNKISTQINTLLKINNEKTIVYSDFAIFIENNLEILNEQKLPDILPEQFRYFITTNNSLHGCTLLIPRTSFLEWGTFDEGLRYTQDYDLWFKLAKIFRFVHIPEILVKSRFHPQQDSKRNRVPALIECNTLLISFVKDLSENEIMEATFEPISFSYAKLALNFLRRGFYEAAKFVADLSINNLYRDRSKAAIKSIVLLSYYKLYLFIGTFIKNISNGWIPGGKLLKNIFSNRDARLNQNLKERFSYIFQHNIFNGKESLSGQGSSLLQTEHIRNILPELVKELDIKTFLDAPCGDWHWMQTVDLGVEQYIGIDIVDKIVEENNYKYSNSVIKFSCLDMASNPLPKADIIFCRDCLVHLTFEDVKKVITNFKKSKSKFLLTTTFAARGHNAELLGNDIWRTLNLEIEPFNFPKPLKMINENCIEENGKFSDKSLGLWLLEDIEIMYSK